MLRAIADHVRAQGWAPSRRELCEATDLAVVHVDEAIESLRERGLIRTRRNTPRAIAVTDAGVRELGLPLGYCVVCGQRPVR